MQQPRRCHRGSILASRTVRRCWQGVVMLGVFSLASGLVQNTFGLHGRNGEVAGSIALKEEHLALLQKRHAELLATRTFLQSDAGILAAARPLGFGRAGERRIMFDNPR